MNHPDTDQLTAWANDLLDADERRDTTAHFEACADCASRAEKFRSEARMFAELVAPRESLKTEIMDRARSVPAAPRNRPVFGALWQAAAAAAVLIVYVAVLLAPAGARHVLEEGKIALEDGREISAPADLDARRDWNFTAIDPARIRLYDESTLDARSGSRVGLKYGGDRGVTAKFGEGSLRLRVVRNRRPFTLVSDAGTVQTREGEFSVQAVSNGGGPMKRTLSGIVVVALTGSLYLSNAHGNIQADTGHSYVLPVSDQPLVAVDQDGVQEALERLEKLATRIAALEKEISGLEKANAQLKKQLAAVGQGWAGSSRRYGVEGVKKGQFRGQGGGGMRFVEPVKKNKKKEDK